MFKFLVVSADKESKQPIYFRVVVKGKNATWEKITKEEFDFYKNTLPVIK